jgi:hypothetical protein
MTGYTFKKVGWPTDNGLVAGIAEAQLAEQRSRRAEQEEVALRRERDRKYKTRWGIMVLHGPMPPSRRESIRRSKKRARRGSQH